ncbi:MAG: NADPH:quinone reductase [Verrucomicrobia bacterium]|jgi:NADPH2:quinone reductase|nr:NADPH:quinone reductase [Verrucomicrobiota bacterium]
MKAAYITRTGPPEVITYGDLPAPMLEPGQCRVQVTAVDVNPIDVYWRAGLVPARMEFPFVLGRDLAGTVMEVGQGITRFRPGDRVWATNLGFGGRSGTFAEEVAVDEEWLFPTPKNVRDEDVVAVSLVGVTAYLGLMRHARLQAGEVLFVNGGTGGVGSCVVQMAKRLGATVITTAGSDHKASLCRKLGADQVILYKTEDVSARVKELAPDGVHVWWETLREPDFENGVALLAMRGRMVVMAGREARPAFPVGPFYVKDCSLHGFAMFNASSVEIGAAADAINGWLADGTLKACIDRVLPLAAAAEAHRLQEGSTLHKSGELSGKIVLKA